MKHDVRQNFIELPTFDLQASNMSIRIAIAGPIPPGGEAATQQRLELYRVLSEPLPALPPPDQASFHRLSQTAPHANAAIGVVARHITLARCLGARCFTAVPLLLVGPPGSGKTWLARQLAGVLSGHVTRLYPCGGLNNAIPLRGQSRAFHDSGPGLAVQLLAQHRSASGCIIWDEIDKVGTSTWNGDPLQALIQMLEAETSTDLYDDFLQTQVNLSLVNHIATANRIDGLPPPLLSRFQIVDLDRPDGAALRIMTAQFRADLARRLYVSQDAVPVLDELSIERLLRQYDDAPDLRAVQRGYEEALLRLAQQNETCDGSAELSQE